MTKAERLSASRRKKAADPNQQQKSGAAKPTYVRTDAKKKGNIYFSFRNRQLYRFLSTMRPLNGSPIP